MTDFLQAHSMSSDKKKHSQSHKKNRSWSRTFFLRIFFLGCFLLLFVGILVAFNYADARSVYTNALSGKQQLEEAQKFFEAQRFGDGATALVQARKDFQSAKENLDHVSELKFIPLVGRQIRAVEDILIAGIQLSSALEKIVRFGDEIFSVLEQEKDLTLDQITPEQKVAILKRMYEAPPDLQGARAEVDLAMLAMNRLPKRGLVAPVQKAAATLSQHLPLMKQIIDQAVPAIEAIPPLVGYPELKSYLFLLQNNNELRPTGGFIGTYGILKLKNGDIVSFSTDNIYNLDEPYKDTLFFDPPWQLKKYLGATQWFLRDSNWEPDFPTAAARAEELYLLEGGTENLDGVIAVTPVFLQSLLALTGPISAHGIEFTSDNFVEQLEYQVGQGFYRQGISASERKEVIGALADTILSKLMKLPKERWKDLWLTLESNLSEKHILLSLKESSLQQLVQAQGWGGEIKASDGDFLFVVDANMASLKSDPGVKRTIRYSITDDKERGLVGRVDIQYRNEGYFGWKSTRYRTYTRVYVPEGSELLESAGVMENDKLHGGNPGEVEVVNEFSKTRFGAFISIEPQQEGTLSFLYKLPQSLTQQVQTGTYTLFVQKQPGTLGHILEVNVDIGRSIREYAPLDKGEKKGNNELRFSTDLARDRLFLVQWK
ncbi:MAG: hypothetical protein A3B74_03850 [Candidatus Kerfeldbacteria bacterium RIFCSPHIGHO2_02_FULL_42_14]|uniref:DUF4012 domain-containing protein n=1 Tax=Candidatus Kerfeldbacteria bacterium RIFCSPHIGHO2_02_FULL_42_14 TaxID=1798540 RepID=A0A1G2AQ22_9BACT|nr:MAG: hypothetical protein A3B74_03850 [Candidatus Kerfeldbacteria bacterium RIFCSPHIGHO2_02_FULL_42_14]OGY80647.1 MAG: hypothetical protein A3E60_04350 [Candidatus Kerfeldbacteria bacterium RIFCSPHIGHO2_12_FULL_42_13]OGY82571.1 MAG: hypothetical protein A3I91_04010 [Candidatus Kerfeldbacteria bacterium RIFCSPLOWO2_02_FULL_42_19]OGY85175.1 MAG: hypothetical protein A3G01_01140 [Candidatus Kerfeldbacteria bacterium RIFCSPLOWO2_12_FULL_43_9]